MLKPLISAIICTHNRDAYLGAAIDSLLEQDFTGEFEVIVVDNGSVDQTRTIVETKLSNPLLKYIWEPNIGLSIARNTGAKATSAAILAYLDDDAIADFQWLKLLYNSYQNNPKLAIAGGKVTLIWPSNQAWPSWISPVLASSLGAYDLGDQFLYIETPGMTPRGVNYSIRRSFLEEIGGFDPNLGRIGKKLLSNEELLVTELALRSGWQCAYIPDALVAHNVAPERVKLSWFIRRGWWQGISECYREELVGKKPMAQIQSGTERLLRGVYKSVKYFRDPAQCFENLVYSCCQVGYLMTTIMRIWQRGSKD
jgi:glycosyltransferase involved in cell wall biosynthesis